MRRYFGESRFIIIHFGNAASFLYGTGCCLSLAQSATVKIKNIVASADMRRHSDTLRGAKRRRKRGLRGENRISGANSVVFPSFSERGLTGENARANVVSRRALSPVKIKIPVASADMRRHSDTLRGAKRRRKWGLTGEKTHEQAFCAARVFAPPSTVVMLFLSHSPTYRHPSRQTRSID